MGVHGVLRCGLVVAAWAPVFVLARRRGADEGQLYGSGRPPRSAGIPESPEVVRHRRAVEDLDQPAEQ